MEESTDVSERAAAIRGRIEGEFRRRGLIARQIAELKPRCNLEAAVASGKDILEGCDLIYRNILKDRPEFMSFTDEFKEMVRAFFALRTYVLHEAWHLREDLSDEQVVDLGADLPDDLTSADLAAFRDEGRKLDFEMPMDELHAYYKTVMSNLRAYAYLGAHKAKSVDSFSAARSFMLANDMLSKRLTYVPLRMEPEHVEEMFRLFDEGQEALWLACDYATMRPWSEVRDEARRQLDQSGSGEARA